jgi:hypothetical protein
LKKKFYTYLILLAAVFLLTACGAIPTGTPEPTLEPATPTRTVSGTPTTLVNAVTPTRSDAGTPTILVNRVTPTRSGGATPTRANNPTPTRQPARTGPAVIDRPSLTDELPERTVVRTFTDVEGRQVRLTYGRGTGHGGDYGWAHIYGKHVKGIWYDGGTITTYPKALGTKTPDEVVELIGKSIQDKKPDDAGNGRRTYVYAVPGTNRDVFTVVGDDGTIITAYPVAHGSKDEDS